MDSDTFGKHSEALICISATEYNSGISVDKIKISTPAPLKATKVLIHII